MIYYAHAKINLRLEVEKCLKNDFHYLHMVNAKIGLADALHIEESDKNEVTYSVNELNRMEKNTCLLVLEQVSRMYKLDKKFKIYIAPQVQINIDNHSPLNTTDLRLIRRIVRDMKFRNCPAAGTIDMWQSVREGEFRWIYPNQEGANYVFNSELTYELAVLRTHALPALREIKPTDPEYLVANRLIKYLKYFRPIDDESIIPCNSLLREFIGGSCFNV